jgi:hypothetical protein
MSAALTQLLRRRLRLRWEPRIRGGTPLQRLTIGAVQESQTTSDQPVQPVLDHQRRDRRDLDHPMAQRIWILAVQQGAAVSAGIGVVFHHLVHPFNRQQLRPRSRMTRVTAALAATALTPCRRLKPRAVAGGWFGGVARAAADPLPQAGQFSCQGGELAAELSVLLLLGQDEGSGLRWPQQPIRVWNPGR